MTACRNVLLPEPHHQKGCSIGPKNEVVIVAMRRDVPGKMRRMTGQKRRGRLPDLSGVHARQNLHRVGRKAVVHRPGLFGNQADAGQVGDNARRARCRRPQRQPGRPPAAPRPERCPKRGRSAPHRSARGCARRYAPGPGRFRKPAARSAPDPRGRRFQAQSLRAADASARHALSRSGPPAAMAQSRDARSQSHPRARRRSGRVSGRQARPRGHAKGVGKPGYRQERIGATRRVLQIDGPSEGRGEEQLLSWGKVSGSKSDRASDSGQDSGVDGTAIPEAAWRATRAAATVSGSARIRPTSWVTGHHCAQTCMCPQEPWLNMGAG